MEVLKIVGMLTLGVGGIIKGIINIKSNTGNPLRTFLSFFVIVAGIIGYVLWEKMIFLIIGIIGFILILILG